MFSLFLSENGKLVIKVHGSCFPFPEVRFNDSFFAFFCHIVFDIVMIKKKHGRVSNETESGISGQPVL